MRSPGRGFLVPVIIPVIPLNCKCWNKLFE
nr:MAG TPA_asm: hypothetical protein [Caudoviricetes sp.]